MLDITDILMIVGAVGTAGITSVIALIKHLGKAALAVKNGDLETAIEESKAAYDDAMNVIDYLDSENDTVTTAPDSPILEEKPLLRLMGPKQWEKVLKGLDEVETTAVTAFINTQQDAKLQKFTVTTTKGTFYIEDGYIEDFVAATETPESAKWRVTHDVNGHLIGLFDVLGLFSDSKGKKPLTQFSRSGPNYAYLRYKMTSVGVINPGIQVGDEEVIWLGTDADTSDELNTVRTDKFDIWTYPATIEDDTLEIKVFKGYETAGTGTKETELKKIEGSTTVFTIPVVD